MKGEFAFRKSEQAASRGEQLRKAFSRTSEERMETAGDQSGARGQGKRKQVNSYKRRLSYRENPARQISSCLNALSRLSRLKTIFFCGHEI